MIQVRSAKSNIALAAESHGRRLARQIGLSAVAAMLAGTALVPATAQTYDITANNAGGIVSVTDFVGAPLNNPPAISNGLLRLTSNANLSFGGDLDDSLGLLSFEKRGTGTLTLSGNNSFSGVAGFRTFGGTVFAGSTSALSPTTFLLITPGFGATTATVDLAGFNNAITYLQGNAGAIVTNTVGTATLTLNSSATRTFSGGLQGNIAILKRGTGTLILSNTNPGLAPTNTTGAITLEAGGISVGNNNALGSGELTVTGASTLSSVAGFGAVLLDNNIVLNANLTVVPSTTTALRLNGVISGAGSLIKSNVASTLRLAGNNTYLGGTSLLGGRVEVGSNTALSNGAVTLGGTIVLALLDPAVGLTLANNFTAGATALTVEAGNLGTTFEFSGNIAGTRSVVLSSAGGTGTLLLSGANSYSGATRIQTGVLGIGSAGAVASTSQIRFENSGTGISIAAAGLTINRQVTSFAGAGAVSATINTGGFDTVFSGRLHDANTGGGDVLALTKAGAGTLTISNAAAGAVTKNILSGGVAVNAGTLNLTGRLENDVTVNGATFAGTGVVAAGTTTINSGSVLSPGDATMGANATGGLTLNNLTLAAGSSVRFDLGAPSVNVINPPNDLVVVNGDLNLGGVLNFNPLGGFGVGTYRLFTYGGAVGGAFGAGPLPGGFSYSFIVGGGNVDLNVQLPDFYWDGTGPFNNNTVDGGTGNWTPAGTNWTDVNGMATLAWGNQLNVSRGFFQGVAGTITLTETRIFEELHFLTDGYVINPEDSGELLTGLSTTINVADGMTATINVTVDDGVGLTKIGNGTLNLGNANTIAGGISLNAGRININNDEGLGFDGLTMAAGTTLGSYAGQVTVANNVIVAGGVTFSPDVSLRLNGGVAGSGGFTKTGAGELGLAGANSFMGDVSVTSGTINLLNSAALGNAANVLNLGNGTNLIVSADIANNITTDTAAGIANDGSARTLGGVISGNGLVTFTGAGNLTLNGVNTYTGGSNINAGTVTLGANTALGTNTVTMANGTTLANNSNNLVVGNAFSIGNVTVATGANTFTLGGVVDGAGLLTKTGSGNLILNAANGYTGGTALTAGAITVGTNTALGTNGLVMTGGTSLAAGVDALSVGNAITTLGVGTVDTGAFTFTLNGAIGGAGSITKNGAGILVLNGANAFMGGSNITEGTVTVGTNTALGTNMVTMANGTVLANNFNGLVVANTFSIGNVEVATGAGTFTLNGGIGGAGLLTKTGSGTLILNGNNSFAGGVAANAGMVLVGSNTALGAGAASFAANTTLRSGAAVSLGNVINVAGGVTLKASGANSLALTNVISGTGGVTKTGSGQLSLSGNNDFTGGFNHNGGFIVVGSNTAFGAVANLVTVNAAAVGFNLANTVNVGNAFALGGTTQVDVGAADVATLSGNIGGMAGSINKTGTGRLILSGTNTYGAGTNVVGTLQLNNSNAAGTGAITLTGATLAAGGALTLANDIALSGGSVIATNNQAVTLNGLVSGTGGLTVTTSAGAPFGATLVLGNAGNSFAGGLTIGANAVVSVATDGALGAGANAVAINEGLLVATGGFSTTRAITLGGTFGQIDVDGGQTLLADGPISGSQLRKGSAGTLIVGSNGNNFVGGSSIFGTGTLAVAANGALGNGLIELFDGRLASVGSGVVTLANNVSIAAAGNFITIADAANTLELNGSVSGVDNFTKTGAGTLRLNGVSSYSGTIQLTGGELDLEGTIAGGINATNGARVTGNGTANGTTTFANGAVISPGNSPGTLIFGGDLEIADATDLVWDLDVINTVGMTNDLAIVNGNLTLDGQLQVQAGANFNIGTGSYRLFRYNNLLADNIVTLTNGALPLPVGYNLLTPPDGVTYSVTTSNDNMAVGVNQGLGNVLFNVAYAGTYFFDGNGAAKDTVIQGGPGTWNGVSPNFTNSDGLFNLAYVDSFTQVVQFGGAAAGGAIDVVGTRQFGTINFTDTGYTLGGAGDLIIDNGTINVTGGIATVGVQINGNNGLTKIGAGNLALNAANGYTGGTSINAGTVTVGNNFALSTGTVTMANGTVLANNSNNLNVANAFSIGNVEIATDANTFTLSGVIDGAGLLTKTGSGNLILSGNSNYSGGTGLTAGSLTVTNNGSIGTGALTTTGGTTVFAGLTPGASSVIALANSVVLNGATILNLQGTTGDISDEGVITNLDGTRLTLNGVISGTGSLLATGFGRFNLNGDNSYSGGTTLNFAIAYAGTDTAFGTGVITLDDGVIANDSGALRTLANNVVLTGSGLILGPNDITLNGTISGASELTKRTTSTLTLNGANSYAGNTTLAGGTIVVGTNTALSTGQLTMSGGTTLQAGAADLALANSITTLGVGTIDTQAFTLTLGGVIGGAGSTTKIGGGNLILSGNNSYADGTGLTAGTITVTTSTALGTGRLTATGGTSLVAGVSGLNAANAVTLLAGNLTVDPGAGAATYQLSGVIDGVGGINKVNSGNLILSGVNTYSGGTNLNAGSLTVTNNASIGTGALATMGGSTLIVGTATGVNTAVTLANAVSLGAGTTTVNLQGTLPFTFNNDGSIFTNGAALTLNGVVSGAGALATGSLGTLTLNGNNSYQGGTQINTRTVVYIGSDTAIGTGAVTMGTASGLYNISGATRTLANDFVLNGPSWLGGSSDLVLNGGITGAGTLIKAGAQELVLNGPNSGFTGNSQLRDGRITINTSTALGTGGTLRVFAPGAAPLGASTTLAAGTIGLALANNVTLDAGSNLTVESGAGTFALGGVISGAGAVTKIQAGTLILNGANTFMGGTALNAGTIQVGSNTALGTGALAMANGTTLLSGAPDLTLANAVAITGTGTVDTNGNTLTLGGVVSGDTLSKAGAGTLVLTGANSYTGGTNLAAGTITVAGGNNLGSGTLTAADGTTLRVGTSGGQTITVANNIVTNGVLTVGLGGTVGGSPSLNAVTGLLVTDGNEVTLSGIISGPGSLVTDGNAPGNLTLSAANTYAGGTTISRASVSIGTATSLGSGAVTLDNGGVINRSGGALSIANNIASAAFGWAGGADDLTLTGVLSGGGTFSKIGSDTLTLTNAANSFGGVVDVVVGNLRVNGALNNAAGSVTVRDGATLSGTGSIAGTVTVENGGNLTPGNSPGTLTVGNLNLAGLSNVNFELGAANVLGGVLNDRMIVTGNLVLDGLLNVTQSVGGTFGLGIYNLFSYGTLTDNGLTINGALPGALAGSIQNNVAARQINLIVAGPNSIVLNWDGTDFTGQAPGAPLGQGGAGVWNATNTNWAGQAPGQINATWQPNAVGIFGGTGDTVEVASAFTFAGLAFQAGGYTLANAGGSLTTNTALGSFISVDAALSATINATIAGTGALLKQGAGTLVLGGTNTNSGGVNLTDGILAVTSNSALGTGTLTFTGGTTLRADASVTLANAVALNGTSNVDTQANTLTLNGVVSGAGVLAKNGSGNLVLNGANDYTGGTALTAGSITVGNNTALGTNTLTMTDGTSLVAGADALSLGNAITTLGVGTVDTGAFTLTLDGVIGGAGSLAKNGSGNLVLDGANTYTGGSSITAGTVTVGNNTAFGTNTVTMANDTTLANNTNNLVVGNAFSIGNVTVATGANTFTLAGEVNGAGSITKTGNGNLILNGGNGYGGGTALTAGTITIGANTALGSGQLTMTGDTFLVAGVDGLAVTNGITTLGVGTVDTGANTLALGGVIGGAGSIAKSGSGNLVLNAANTYTGGSNITAGTVTVGNNAALGTNTVTMANGTVLANNSNNLNVANAFSIGNVEVATGASAFTLSGVIGGAGLLTKTGSGNLTLSGANGYAGGTALTAGTITVTTATALGAGTLTATGGTSLVAGADGLNVANAATLLDGNLTVDSGTGTFQLSGVIGGVGGITKINSGNLILSGNSNYSGGTGLTAGSLTVTNNGSIGTGALTTTGGTTVFAGLTPGGGSVIALANSVVLNGATTLNLQGTTGDVSPQGVVTLDGTTLTLNGVVSGAGSLLATGFGRVNLNGDNSYAGGTTLNDAAAYVGTDTAFGTGTVTANRAIIGNDSGALRTLANNIVLGAIGGTILGPNDITLNGVISGVGELTKRTTSTLTLGGANSYAGNTTLAGGTIVVGTNTALGTGTLFAENIGQTTTLRTGAADLTLANAVFVQPAGNLIVDTQAFTFGLNGVINGAGALTKVSNGNLILSGANGFSGGTALTAGTITVNTSTALGTGRLTATGGTSLVAGVSGLNAANAVTLLVGNLTVDPGAGPATFQLSGVIDGVGGINKINTGNLILSGNSSYSGGTNLNAGSLTVTNNGSIGTGALNTTGGTSLIVGTAVGVNTAVTLANAVSLGAGTTAINLQGTMAGFALNNNGSVVTNGAALVLNGVVSGAGALSTNTFGTLTLNGNNSYAGGTLINDRSVVYIGSDTAVGTGTVTMGIATALYNNSGATRTLANNFVLNGPSWLGGSSDLVLNGGITGAGTLIKAGPQTLVLNGNNSGFTGNSQLRDGRITINTSTALGTGGTLRVFAPGAPPLGASTTLAAGTTGLALANNVTLDAGSNLIVESGAGVFTLGGVISGAGAVTKIQAGTLILNGANTFTGGTSLNAGTIQVGTNTALGTNTLAMAGGTTLQSGAANLALANAITTNGLGTIDTQAFTFTLNGAIGGTGSITKIGSGNLVLNAANTYTGGSNITAGTVTAGNNTAFGTNLVTMAGGTVLANNTNNLVVGNAFSIGNVEVATGDNTFTMSGVVNGAGLLTKTGSGNLILTGSNGFTGGTALTAGTITFNTDTAFGTGAITTTGGTTLVAGVNDPSNGQVLTLANNIALGAGTTFLDLQGTTISFSNNSAATSATGTNLTLNGVVSGAGTFDISDRGRVNLNGANSYSGGTVISTTAIVYVGSDTAFGTGAVTTSIGTTVLGNDSGALRTLANAFTLNGNNGMIVTGPNDITLNGVVSGPAGIIKVSTSTLTLNAANSYSGFTSLRSGRITVGGNMALGTGTVFVWSTGVPTILAAGTTGLALANNFQIDPTGNLIVESGAGSFTLNGVISSTGALTKTQSGTLILNGANTFSGGTSLNVGTIQVGTNTALGTSGLVMADSTTLQAGVADLALANAITTNGLGTIDTQAFTFTLNGVIGGAGSISKIGSGNLVLNAANTYTGGSFINAGTVTVGNNSALGTSAVIMLDGTTLTPNTGDLALANEFNIGNVTVATQAFTLTLNGPIGGSGPLTKTGTGTLVLNGSNAYGGGTALTEGTINIGANSALGSGQLTMSDATFLVAGVDGLAVANGITTLGVGTVDTGANTLTLGGVIDGAGSVTKTGTGNLVLNGANTYVGGSSITAGTVTVGNNAAFGTGLVTMADGTTLANNANNLVVGNAFSIGNVTVATGANSFTLAGVVNGAGLLTKTGSGNLVLNGANGFTGGTALTAGTITVGTNTALGTNTLTMSDGTSLVAGVDSLSVGNAITTLGVGTVDTGAFTFTLGGVIGGAGSIAKIGSGTLVLNGANTYTGGTALNVGTIQVGTNASLGTGQLTMTGGTTLVAGTNNLTVANNIATLGVGTVNTGANTFTLTGVISGDGSIAKIGSGNLIVSGTNSYTGGTALNAGTITVANNSALGTGTLAMAGGTTLNTQGNVTLANAVTTAGVGTINTNTGLTLTINGIVSGAGSIAKTGPGLLILNGANSYSGGTALNAGTIRVGNNTALGTGNVAAAAGTILQAGGTVTLANNIAMAGGMTVDNFGQQLGLGGVISGTGPLSVIDSTGVAGGVLTLSGTNSYTGGTVVTGTALRVSADVNLGNAAGNVTLNNGTLWTTANFATARTIALGTGGGTLQVAPNTAFTINGTIAGTALTKTGGGELVLNTLNSYLGGTSLNAGTITVANNLALGIGTVAMAGGTTLNTATNLGTTPNSPIVTLANNFTTAGVATVNTATGLTLVLNGSVAGAGSLNKTSEGLLVLNGANSYAGGTTLVGGTIRVGANTALGTGRLTTTASTTLQAGVASLTLANAITLGAGITRVDTQAFTFTLSGVASGVGGVSKVGTGVLNLTGASTYTGATTVAAGTLNVTGSLVSAVTVNSGAAITGTGTVGALNVLAGGSVAPGAPATTNSATLTVTGAATLAGTYTVDITPSANDRITAGGALTLGGTLAVVPTVPSTFTQFNQLFTVASGATRTGTFATVSGLDQVGIAFAPVVDYTATSAIIRLAPQSLVVLGNRFGGISGNQLEVALAFDRAVAAGYNPQAFFNVYANGGSALPQTLRQMSGEQRATERRVVLDTTRVFREAALDRLNGGLASLGGQQVSSSDGDRTLTFWLRGAGSWGKTRTSGAATAFTAEQRGVITGLDWAKAGLTVGGAFHYTSTNVEYQVLGGSSNVETVGGTAYAGYRQDGGVVVNGGVSVAGARTNGSRAITLPSFAQTLAGTTTGTTYQAFGELAWDLAASADTRIEPFARFTYVKADLGGLTETGGVAALAATKQGYDITVTNLGARVGGNVADGKVALSAGASWQNTGGDRDAATVIGIPAVGQNSLIRSVQIDRDALSLQADVGVNVSDTIRFSLGYSGLIGKRNDDHGGRATLNFAF